MYTFPNRLPSLRKGDIEGVMGHLGGLYTIQRKSTWNPIKYSRMVFSCVHTSLSVITLPSPTTPFLHIPAISGPQLAQHQGTFRGKIKTSLKIIGEETVSGTFHLLEGEQRGPRQIPTFKRRTERAMVAIPSTPHSCYARQKNRPVPGNLDQVVLHSKEEWRFSWNLGL